MTVEQLIVALKRFDPDLPVVARGQSVTAFLIERAQVDKMMLHKRKYGSSYEYSDSINDPNNKQVVMLD